MERLAHGLLALKAVVYQRIHGVVSQRPQKLFKIHRVHIDLIFF